MKKYDMACWVDNWLWDSEERTSTGMSWYAEHKADAISMIIDFMKGEIKERCLVRPKKGKVLLFSGCERYDSAVVVSVNPFILVSRKCDMKWTTCDIDDFEICGAVGVSKFRECEERAQ